MRSASILALAGAAAAQYKGFNYGATNNDGSVRQQADFANLFNAAKNLDGASGFTSARLYTMIQGSTTNTPTSAIQAAIDTKTTLLLGLWASAGQVNIDNEISALLTAINQYGTAFTSLIAGISVGSEDLYRITPTGIENNSGVGAGPDVLSSYIYQVKGNLTGTAAAKATVGHVDTWTAWVNGSNAAVIEAVDWLGMDGYPYFETTLANSIDNGAELFFQSYNSTVAVAQNKPVWITETGWPVSGATSGQAVPSTQNAETYWQEVACRVLGNINTWWYTLYDPQPSGGISFGLQGSLGGAPLYDLTCSASSGNTETSSSATSAAATTLAAATSSPAVSSPAVSSPAVSSTAVSSPANSSPAVSSPAVTSSVVSEVGGETYTVWQTTLVTITSCPSGCDESTTSSAPATSSTGKSCPTNLSGEYQYPHLIVPVDSTNPDKAYGTSYDGEITPSVSSIFNFDIPASYAGKTCSLVFLFPEKSQLETSSFTFNGKGGIKVSELTSPATTSTTFNNAPAAAAVVADISSIAPGNSYLITSHECGAGQRIAFEFTSTGGLDLDYFQDYNPSPLGAYITVC